MPGGGQIGIVAYGNQNRLFNGNPEQTFYYKVFKRFTHFSQESITIALDGPSLMMMDTPIQLRAKIPRYADLMTDLTLVFQLPDIYSKLYPANSPPSPYTSPNSHINTLTPSFRWIHMLGAFIIQNISIYVGGSQIQTFPGEWLAVRAATDMPADKYLKWRTLVGDIPELTEPEWGAFGKARSYPYEKGGYPQNMLDASGSSTTTAPSIRGREIRVPLPFWFTESWGAALPLVGLQLHEVEVQIQLRTLRDIFRIMDNVFQTEPIRPGRRLQFNPNLPVNTLDQPMASLPSIDTHYNNLTLQANYQTYNDPIAPLQNYYIAQEDVGATTPTQSGFIMNARLEGNYIYLTEKEQAVFAERELMHVVHQVQTFTFPSITAKTRLDLDSHGLLNRIVFFGRRSDAISSRNDFINLSNWKYLNQPPYWPLSAPTTMANNLPIENSGRLISYAQRDILQSARLLLAGNELQEEKSATYFEVQTPFLNTVGSGEAGLNPAAVKPIDVMGPIYQIAFGLNVSDHEQPSGSLNTSRIREVQLEVQPWNLDPYSTFAYDFTVYCESINTVKFMNGMGGLGFAI